MNYGPTIKISEEIHKEKYRGVGETFKEAMSRVANALKDDEEHYLKFRDALYNMRFLPAGRVQAAMGAPRTVTPYNCFVSQTIEDSMEGIMDSATKAATTLRLGGGIGYDFSTLRPSGDLIRSLESRSSGPLSFMNVFDSICGTIAAAGHRRGAQMGVMRVDHPDIEKFITAKNNTHNLTNFNISVAVTDEFMEAVKQDKEFDLRWGGRVYRTVNAKALWETILRSTWDWAEPGVLFIDRINKKNNLWYCEEIAATNPCGEQPLPPHGACLLGSFNLVKYIIDGEEGGYDFDWDQFTHDIPYVVRAMDNVVDRAVYPLEEQRQSALNKRRMGLGVTGVANTMEVLGYPYGSEESKGFLEEVLRILRNTAYKSSVSLAMEKGPFPLWDERYLESDFAKTLPSELRELIRIHGIRNSHLLSIAPTGTISLSADNVSSGIEPVFSKEYTRTINMPGGIQEEVVQDYGYRVYGVEPVTSDKLSVEDHVTMLNIASKYVDSACSKTCNVGSEVSWERFKNVYMMAYEGGASGCTTFRAAGKRGGILVASKDEEVHEEEQVVDHDFIDEGAACYYDPKTGLRSCE